MAACVIAAIVGARSGSVHPAVLADPGHGILVSTLSLPPVARNLSFTHMSYWDNLSSNALQRNTRNTRKQTELSEDANGENSWKTYLTPLFWIL